MALEGLGVASSAFAVVSLAGQLADGVQKLVVFWKSVENAPAEVARLLNELGVLSRLLVQVRDISGALDESDILLHDALKDCEDKVSALLSTTSKVSSDLSSKSRGKRNWVAIKNSFKRKELEALELSIDRAKSTLHLVQSTSSYNLALRARAVHEKTAIEVASIRQTLQNLELSLLSTDIKMQLHEPFALQENTKIPNSAAIEETAVIEKGLDESPAPIVSNRSSNPLNHLPSHQVGTITRRRGKNKHYWETTLTTPLLQLRARSRSYDLTTTCGSEILEGTRAESNYVFFPQGFLQKLGISTGIQITATSTYMWKYTLQPFRAITPDSLIFDFCRDGNIEGIQRLFARGDASPYDRDLSGSTPLTIAVRASQIEVAEFLLQQGSDPHARDWRFERQPIQEVIDSQGIEIEPKLSMIHLLEKYRREDYDTSEFLYILGRALLGYRPQKAIDMPQTQRQEAQMKVFTTVMPRLASGDLEKIWGLESALTFGSGPSLLTWLLQHINGQIDDLEPGDWCLIIPHRAINKRIPLRAPDVMRMIMQKTTNLHRCLKDGFVYSTPSTPTMLAMQDRGTFLAWRSLLQELDQDIPQFVRTELKEGLLAEAGWTENSLRYLFEEKLPLDLHTSPSIRGFPGCERCHRVETDIMARLVVDLKWRRELRDIRQQFMQDRPTSTIVNIDCKKKKGVSSSTSTNIDYQSKQEVSASSSIEIVISSLQDNPLPYRLVCSYPCLDGICVAWMFENDLNNEPDLPSFPFKLMDDKNETQSDTEISNEEVEDRDPTFDMPGSFVEGI